ncbi:MAG: tetratricopeptide repeat protein [Candidatus Electrothrix sp. AR4]|nr:tetratricopeptide repeat protein [Candidatus Electrothrix sp. AR4]
MKKKINAAYQHSGVRILRRNSGDSLFLLGFLIIIVFSLYSHALDAPFLFDDTNNIEQNDTVHMTALSITAFKTAAQGPRPVAMLSFAFDHYLHGLSPFWFRVTNLFIHICTAMALYFILRSTITLPLVAADDMRRYRWLPLLSTLLWTVHPLHIQSVTYIVQRMNSLAGLFFLLSLLFYIHARLSVSGTTTFFFGFSCILSGSLALGSKPNTAVLPLVIVLYEWFFFQKKTWRTHSRLPVLIVAFVVMLAAAYYFLGGHPAGRLEAWYAKNEFTPVQRVMTEFRVVVLYLSLLVFPHPSRLNIDHDILLSTSLTAPPTTALSLGVIVILLLTGILTAHRLPFLAFGVFYFFLNLVIESTVIPLDFIFEHRTYIPSMMLIAGVVSCLIRFFRWDIVKIVFAVALSLWSVWTYERNAVWNNGIALWQDSAEKSPDKPRPHESLAYYLEKENRYDEALRHYKKAVKLNPNNASTLNNIGNLYMKTNDLHAAFSHYTAALRIRPNYKEAHNNIGNALSKLGNIEEAVVHYEKTLELDPNYAKAHANLANILAALGKMRLSMQHYNQAVELEKDNIETYYNRSILLLRLNRFAEAEQALQKVIEHKQDFKEAYNNLGVAQEYLGDSEAARASYQQALRIDPHFKDASQNLEGLQK